MNSFADTFAAIVPDDLERANLVGLIRNRRGISTRNNLVVLLFDGPRATCDAFAHFIMMSFGGHHDFVKGEMWVGNICILTGPRPSPPGALVVHLEDICSLRRAYTLNNGKRICLAVSLGPDDYQPFRDLVQNYKIQ